MKRRILQRLTESWQIKLLSSVLNAAVVTILGITKMLVVLAMSFITTTFLHTEKKERLAGNASDKKQEDVSELSEYDKVGHC